jgi:hypothetical protein
MTSVLRWFWRPILFNVTPVTNPDGAEVYFTDALSYLAVDTSTFPDVPENWKRGFIWKEMNGPTPMRGPFYFRAYWPTLNKKKRSGEITIAADSTVRLSPD